MFRLWGSRRSGWPFRYASSTLERISVLQPVAQRGQPLASSAMTSRQISAAWPKPTASGTGTVPERMPRSWPPPSIMGAMRTRGSCAARRGRRCPWARRSCGRCRTAGRCPSPRRRPESCPRPGSRRCGRGCPCSLASLPISAIGLDGADLVVGEHDRDQDGLVGDAPCGSPRGRPARRGSTGR